MNINREGKRETFGFAGTGANINQSAIANMIAMFVSAIYPLES